MRGKEKILKPGRCMNRHVSNKAIGGAITMKKTMLVVSIVTIMAMLVGCAPEVTQADKTPAPVSQTAQVILAEGDVATPVPEPEVVLTDLPDDAEIPNFYSEVLIPGVAERVFAFTDDTGKTQLRAYGELVPVADSEPANADNDAAPVESEPAADPADSTTEVTAGFFPIEVIQTGEDESDEPVYSVEVVSGVQDVVKEQDDAAGTGTLVEPDDSVLIPEGFEPVDGVVGLFTYSPTEDEVYYFAYCVFTEGAGGFYPADANGAVAPGVLPVMLDEEGKILVILDVNGEIIYTSVVEPDVTEDNTPEGDGIIEDEVIPADKEKTETNNKSDSKKDSKPVSTPKPESKPEENDKPASTPEPEEPEEPAESVDNTPAATPEPEPTWTETIYDPYENCTMVGRVVCNTCGADITNNLSEHGEYHMIERDENFSYREQMGWKFPDGHIEWLG